MRLLLILLLASSLPAVPLAPAPVVRIGAAYYYAESYGDWTGISALSGYYALPTEVPVAVPLCSERGRTGWLVLPNIEAPVLIRVVDCGAIADLASLQERDIIVEIPYWLAAASGFIDQGHTDGAVLWLDEVEDGSFAQVIEPTGSDEFWDLPGLPTHE